MRTITLKYNGLGRYDDVSPFIIADNSLELKIILPEQSGEFYLVTENNGLTQKRLLGRDTIVIDCLTVGELKAAVKHYFKGELIKTYKIEPLILKEVEGSISAEPELAVLKDEISALKSALSELCEGVKVKSEELENRKQKTAQNISALIRFAYKDNCENVYLEDGTVEEFLFRFGFSLNEEDIKEIFGGDENE